MLKPAIIIIIALAFFNTAYAQKRDTTVYFIKSPGKVVSTADSADFFLMVLPPDTSIDKNLFVIKEYYKNGKMRMVGNSTNTGSLKFQGSQMYFFSNGHRMRISTFKDGEQVGDEIAYFPNGKFYYSKKYEKGKRFLYQDCKDSIGNILAENGTGKWKEYSEDFKQVIADGDVEQGVETGTWHKRIDDSVDLESVTEKGRLMSSRRVYRSNGQPVPEDNIAPEFPGGIEAFYQFIQKNMRYPHIARQNGTQGKVTVQFVLERDGSLTDVKVVKGIGDGCDEEAVRIIKLSPLWKPGIQNGKPVRVQYNVPVTFSLDN